MANKMKLAEMLRSIGMSTYDAEMQIKVMTGVRVSRQLLDDLIDERGHRKSEGKRFLIAEPKLAAVLKWLSNEMGRSITINDLSDDLEVV